MNDYAHKDPLVIAELTAQELEKLDQVRAAATARMKTISQKDKEKWDQALDKIDFDLGDDVKLTHEGRYGLELQYKGPYVVIGKNPDFGTYKLNSCNPGFTWIDSRLCILTRNRLALGLTLSRPVLNGVLV